MLFTILCIQILLQYFIEFHPKIRQSLGSHPSIFTITQNTLVYLYTFYYAYTTNVRPFALFLFPMKLLLHVTWPSS